MPESPAYPPTYLEYDSLCVCSRLFHASRYLPTTPPFTWIFSREKPGVRAAFLRFCSQALGSLPLFKNRKC